MNCAVVNARLSRLKLRRNPESFLMPEILESHSTGILAGTRSVTRLDVQPISSRSTRPVSAEGTPWDTGVTILGRRQGGEIVIEVNSAAIVGSGIALAAVGALVNSLTLT